MPGFIIFILVEYAERQVRGELLLYSADYPGGVIRISNTEVRI